MAVTTEFERQWLECQGKYGAGIDSGEVQVLEPGDIDAAVSLPAVKFTSPYVKGGNNVFQDFRYVPMQTFVLAVQNQADTIKLEWEDWFGEDPSQTSEGSGIRKIYANWFASTQNDWSGWFGTAPSGQDPGSGVQKDWEDLKEEAQAATLGAELVNASLSGTNLTVVDRYGVSSTSNVKGDRGDVGPKGDKGDTGDPFAIYRTYLSIADMNADAANVPEGKFVCIASNTEDPDNAKLYVKNSVGTFTFLTDLSGAQGIKGDKGDKGDDLHWDEMTTEEKDEFERKVAEEVAEQIVFASDETCEDIIDELT